MTEEVSSLKSFRNFWQIAQTTSETSLELTAKTDRGGAKSSSVDTGFDFPFIHLDSSDFDFHEYHFPFSRIDSSVFDSPCVRQRTAFPFSHWAQSLFGPESKTEKKPATGEKSEPKKSRPEKKSRTEKKPDSPLSRLMQMVGLDDVKREFLSARDRIKAAQARDEEISVRSLKLDLIITGNHGTGRTTLARLYEEHLESLGVGGYDIAVLDDYDDERSFYAHKGVYIVTSLRENVKDIFGDSDACGRFSRRIDIKDYSEDELLAVLIKMLKEESFKVEGGFKAPFLRSFVRQVARRRSQKDFANIDTLIAEIKKVLHRRVERLEKLTKKKDTVIVNFPHLPYILTESDFCGLNPTNFYEESETWKKLEKMAGMEKVKEAVKELVSRRNSNYARERKGTKALEASLNYVFLGPPGRGKTTVAALFGQIIAELGYIESSEVVIKKPTDFLGSYVGHSEKQTKKILEETEGKILIIDEVHMFYHSSDHGTDDSDIYRKGIVDTIVAHVDNEPGNGRCIILMGYPERMKELYRNTNPGFQRRFPLEDAFVFENYDDEALGQILDIMLTSDGIAATENAKAVAMDVLRRERDRPNFGNGGAVRTLLSRATNTYSRRMETLAKGSQDSGNDATPPGKEEEEPQILLEPQDFDPEYDRGLRVDKDYTSLFQNLVGFQDIITTFKGYQTMAANMRKRDLDPRDQIPFTFVFKGAPGTGKTTTARALGQIYYTMGFLSTTEVMDCSVTDLIGEAQGLTGPKVQNLLERALGKVLFIDEAYRLGQKDLAGVFISRFAQEAVGELVDCMTKERFAHKLVIVLAGYERDMNQLMSTNEGLRGRFSELQFPNMRPRDCLRLLQRKLDEKKVKILDPSKKSRKMALDKVINLFKKLSKTEAWANARDVETLSKRIIRQVFLREDLPVDGKPLTVTLEEIAANLKQLLRERKSKGDRTGNGQKDADPSDSE
jgi:SpoVK/Ycf46/Vps4 family AAA+-type ATPase